MSNIQLQPQSEEKFWIKNIFWKKKFNLVYSYTIDNWRNVFYYLYLILSIKFFFLDWLDIGNNKKAIQEADKVLKKQPNLQCAKVLKGLATLRMGRKEKCEALISTVVSECPTDDTTLQALTICYREMHQR